MSELLFDSVFGPSWMSSNDVTFYNEGPHGRVHQVVDVNVLPSIYKVSLHKAYKVSFNDSDVFDSYECFIAITGKIPTC